MQTFIPKGNMRGFILPTHVFDNHALRLSLGAKVLYAVLCSYAFDKDYCWPSHKTLAHRMGCSVSSIKNYIKELLETKLIAQIHTKSTTRYYMLMPESFDMATPQNDTRVATSYCNDTPHNKDRATPYFALETSPEMASPVTQSMQSKSVPAVSNTDYPQSNIGYPQSKSGYRNNLNNNANKYSPTDKDTQAYLTDFEKVWAVYPKKQSKAFAREAWIQLIKSSELPPVDTLLTAITHFTALPNWQKENGRYIPFLGKWLNGQYWLDAQESIQFSEQEERQRQTQEQSSAAYVAQEQNERENTKAKNALLRPEFELFASRFTDYHMDKPISSMLFGTWLYLENTAKAPRIFDVPQDNALGIKPFLEDFKRNCLFKKQAQSFLPSSAPQKQHGHSVCQKVVA